MSTNYPNRYPYADPPGNISGWVLGGVVGLCLVIVVGLITWDGLNRSQIVRASTAPIHVDMSRFGTGAAPKLHPILHPVGKPASVPPFDR